MKINSDPLKDQFFLTNTDVVQKMLSSAQIKRSDVILEIGAGSGILTKELAKKAKKVIAFEIDKKFKVFLSKLPDNVEINFANAVKYIQLKGKFKKRREFNKIVSNPPYSLCEPLLHNLTFLNYDKVILLVPLKFINKIRFSGIFSSFFDPLLIQTVDKKSFSPVPKTNSAIIDLIKLPDPLISKNLGLFLRQYLYAHESQKVKNSLMEGLIIFNKSVSGVNLTKNESRDIIKTALLDNYLLESLPNNSDIYFKIGECFS